MFPVPRWALLLSFSSLLVGGAAGEITAGIESWVRDLGGTLVLGPDGEVREISLNRSWVGDIGLRRLAGLGSLERLALAQTHVTDSSLEVVASLPSLRDLDLFYCEHVTDSGASTLRKAPRLERLNLRGTKISDSGVKFLTELRHLRWLDIGITEVSDATVELLEALPELEFLAIGGNRVAEVGISSLRSLKRLKHLDLSGAQETDSGIWAVTVTDLNLDEIGDLAGLETLNLASPNKEYVDAVSSGVPRLRGAIRVTDFGAIQLARLSNLRRINLTRSLLTAAGVRSLRSLAHLEDLNLSHAEGIDDRAGRELRALHGLRSLNVSYTRFGDGGLAALEDHPTLRRVVAAGAGLTERGIAAFVAARPGRDVIH